MPRSYPGSTPGIDPRSQGAIPRRFKQKKNCDGLTDERMDRCVSQNSDLDLFEKYSSKLKRGCQKFHLEKLKSISRKEQVLPFLAYFCVSTEPLRIFKKIMSHLNALISS